MRCASILFVCVLAVFMCGCGSSSDKLPWVTVDVSPLSAEVSLGKTQQFTATSYGASDTSVIWYVNDVRGGNSTYGTVSQDGLYTAPTVVPSPTRVTVRAVSHRNPSYYANADVSIVSGVAVSVSPSNADVKLSGAQQFTANVSGTSDSSVTWKVGGIEGGNATLGTISTSGLYTAPATASTPMSVNVTAVSKVDSSKSGGATLTVHGAVTVAVSPSAASVQTLRTQQFAATVNGAANTAVTWQVNGVKGGSSTAGTISSSGLYTAPLSVPTASSNGKSQTVTVTVTAVSQADSSIVASVPVTVFSPNQAQQTTATVLGVSGGNANAASGSTCCGGTLGALVSRGGKQYILSASHVLAPSSSASAGDSIIQPGLLDSSCSTTGTTGVATLSQFVDLQNPSGSLVDAALAQVVDGKVNTQGTIMQLGDSIADGLPTDGAPHAGSGIAPVASLAVAKSGRSTGLTCSKIGAVNVTMNLEFENGCGSGQTYKSTLDHLVSIYGSEFSAEGDSGALIVSQDTADPVALLVASTDSDTVAVPVSYVLAAMADPGTGEQPVFVGSATAHKVAGCSLVAQASSSTTLTAKATQTRSEQAAETGVSSLSSAEYQRALKAQSDNAKYLLGLSGVQGVGITTTPDNPAEAALMIFVIRGAAQDAIPAVIGGVRTVVRESSQAKAGFSSRLAGSACRSKAAGK